MKNDCHQIVPILILFKKHEEVFIGKSKNKSPQAIFHIYSASPTAVCIYVTSQPISANVYEKRACSIHHPTHGGAELPCYRVYFFTKSS